MAVNLWVSGESWQIVYGASGRAKGRGVNSYTSRWLDPTHGTRALSSVTVLVAGGRRAAEPCCGAQAALWRGERAAASEVAPLTAPHRHPGAAERLCCPPPASARILAFFEQPCPLQRGFGQQSWLIPNFQPNSTTAQDYPRYFQIEKKDSFWRGCLYHPCIQQRTAHKWGSPCLTQPGRDCLRPALPYTGTAPK